MSRVNLAIIGGGLVGASLALALQAGAKARGWKILLIEPFAPGDSYQPSYDARSSALSFGTRQIYQRLGVWQEISRRAEPIKQIHVSDRGRFHHPPVGDGRGRAGAGLRGGKRLARPVPVARPGQGRGQLALPGGSHAHGAAADGYRLTLNDETSWSATWRCWPTAAVPACASSWASACAARPTTRAR
jgi:2-octaprenyl-6-methoxyphenol hydroxylase